MEILDIAGFVALLVYWRMVLAFVASSAAAISLSGLLIWFTAGYGVMLVLVGTTLGIIWHSRVEASTALGREPPPRVARVSSPVAFLAYVFVGLVWGAIALAAASSAWLAGVLLLAAVVVVGFWYRLLFKSAVTWPAAAFALISVFLGYLSALILFRYLGA